MRIVRANTQILKNANVQIGSIFKAKAFPFRACRCAPIFSASSVELPYKATSNYNLTYMEIGMNPVNSSLAEGEDI